MTDRVNIPIAFASICLSVMLWLVVYTQNQPAAFPIRTSVRLVPQGLDEQRFVITKIDPTLRVRLLGPEDKLQAFRDANAVAYVDLSESTPGTMNYPVQVYPEWAQQYVVDKPFARVTLEAMTTRRVAVDVDGKGTWRHPGLDLGTPKPDHRTAMVQGPKSQVDQVAKVRAYLDLDAIDPQNVQPQRVDLKPIDANEQPLSLVRPTPLSISIMPVVIVAPSSKVVVISPNFMGSPAPGFLPNGYRASPEQINLTGDALVLAAVSKVQTKTIDVSGTDRERIFRVQLVLPPGTRTDEATTVTVRYYVKPDPSAKVPAAGPRAENESSPGGQ